MIEDRDLLQVLYSFAAWDAWELPRNADPQASPQTEQMGSAFSQDLRVMYKQVKVCNVLLSTH